MVMQEQSAPQEEPQQLGLMDITPEEPVDTDVSIEADAPEEAPPAEAGQPDATAVQQPVEQPAPPPESPPEKTQAQMVEEQRRQQELQELGLRRSQEAEAQRRQALMQRAQAHEKQLLDEGLMPDQARKQTRNMLQYENRLHQQDQQAMELLQFAEGRNIAALQIGMKHGLVPKEVVDDINTLLRSQSPDSMEFEAKRMSELRTTRAEINQLKQNQVKPQAFDNSQGAAEAMSSEDRLIDAYLNGDRSEAAVQAAKRLTFGS